MRQPPLEIILEFARAKGAAEPSGYPLSDQEYLLRRGEGEYASGRFPWSEEVLQDLLAFERARAGAQAVKRLEHVLHDFLDALAGARSSGRSRRRSHRGGKCTSPSAARYRSCTVCRWIW